MWNECVAMKYLIRGMLRLETPCIRPVCMTATALGLIHWLPLCLAPPVQAENWVRFGDFSGIEPDRPAAGQADWRVEGPGEAYRLVTDPVVDGNTVLLQVGEAVSGAPFAWIELPEKISGTATVFYRQYIEADPADPSQRQSWQIGLNDPAMGPGARRYDFSVRKEIDWNQHRASEGREGQAEIVPFRWHNFWLVVDTGEQSLTVYRTAGPEAPDPAKPISRGTFRRKAGELSIFKLSRGPEELPWRSYFSDFFLSPGVELGLPSVLARDLLGHTEPGTLVEGRGTWEFGNAEHPYRVRLLGEFAGDKNLLTVAYLRNLPRPRIGTEDDKRITADLLEDGLLVVELDCGGLPSDSPQLEEALLAFHGALPALVPAVTGGLAQVDRDRIHTVPEGHRLRRNIPFWNIEDHGTYGSLERVLKVYNTTLGERFGVEPVQHIEDMHGPDGQPFDYNLYLDIIHPSGEPEEKVPTIAAFATFCPMTVTYRRGGRRLHPIGWALEGYAVAFVDHVYNPPARTRYYGHFNPGFSLDQWNGLDAGSAAIRHLRTHAADYNLNGRIGALGHSKSSYTVARLADPRHPGMEEHLTFRGFPSGSPQPQPWPGHASSIDVAYISMGMGTRRIQYLTDTTVPLVVAVGKHDHFDHWQTFPELVARLEALDTPHLALWMEELGHTFPYGLDQASGRDRTRLVLEFFAQHLHPHGDETLQVLAVTPADGADGVALDGTSRLMFVTDEELPEELSGLKPEIPLTVRFARSIDPSSIGPDSLLVREAAGGRQIAGTWSASLRHSRFTFSPAYALRPETLYEIVVSRDIRDREGNALDGAVLQSFRTQK